MNSSGPCAPNSREDVEIAIICALPLEAEAIETLFDKSWRKRYGTAAGDNNSYSLGSLGGHNVVLAWMPGMGKASAASVSALLNLSYTRIRLALIVGICGGVPTYIHEEQEQEVLLGDVIISASVIQHDLVRRYPSGAMRKDSIDDNLSKTSNPIRALLNRLRSKKGLATLQGGTNAHLKFLGKNNDYIFPANKDTLYHAKFHHKHRGLPNEPESCACYNGTEEDACEVARKLPCGTLGCDQEQDMIVSRKRKSVACDVIIHFGKIASGDTVMKSGEERDRIAQKEDVIAFEMEGAGAWENVPTIVMKSVCDYADSHKTKGFQKYAAASAAACAKALLEDYDVSDRLLSLSVAESKSLSIVNLQVAETPIVFIIEATCNLGYILISQFKSESAETIFRQALQRLSGEDDMFVSAEASSGEPLPESRHVFEYWSITGSEQGKRDGKDNITLYAMNNLGVALIQQAKYVEAEKIYREIVSMIKDSSHGRYSDRQLSSMHNLAQTVAKQKRYGEAETMFQQVLSLRAVEIGKGHPRTLYTMHAIGNLYFQQKLFRKASEILTESLELYTDALGIYHPDTRATMALLGLSLMRQELWPKAISVFRELVNILEKLLGNEHNYTRESRSNLAFALFSDGEYQEAIQHYQMLINDKQDEVKLDNLAYMYKISICLGWQHKLDEARIVLEEVVRLSEEILGAGDERTVEYRYDLEQLLLEMNSTSTTAHQT